MDEKPNSGKRRHKNSITIFSGGTAANSVVDVFNKIAERRKYRLNFVIPISDNGGSSSELIRFVGGPSVGDIRSRLVRLIPNDEGDEEKTALKTLFEYRLCSDPLQARTEWRDMVEARHRLWTFIGSPKRELIRSVLNTLNLEIVKRARPTSTFNFTEASIGNMFLTGARLFSGSLESAIYFLSMICSIPSSVSVLPAINSNFTHHICAGLADGSSIAGQVAISHPSAPTALPNDSPAAPLLTAEEYDRVEDANLPGSLPALRKQHISFSKDDPDREGELPARISRIWYINPYGHEIWPVPNPKVLDALRSSEAVVYSIGSLYTSVVPSLVLRGVGEAIAGSGIGKKVLLLNATLDRETGPRRESMEGTDFVRAVARAAGESTWVGAGSGPGRQHDQKLSSHVSHLVYLVGEGAPQVHVAELEGLGIRCVQVAARNVPGKGMSYVEAELAKALDQILDE